jgi:hypothetical protein
LPLLFFAFSFFLSLFSFLGCAIFISFIAVQTTLLQLERKYAINVAELVNERNRYGDFLFFLASVSFLFLGSVNAKGDQKAARAPDEGDG